MDKIKKIGVNILENIKSDIEAVMHWTNFLKNYKFNQSFEDDPYGWISVVLSLKSVDSKNLGIGSILVNEKNEVVSMGHNQVFQPYFRSDRHAEMVVMSEFEKRNQCVYNMKSYRLYTSLESCPMCLTRLIISGVGGILHVAPDSLGGMVHIKHKLPNVWQYLSENQKIKFARCSPEIVNSSKEIFLINKDELDNEIKERSR
jgi:cytosine deaminase